MKKPVANENEIAERHLKAVTSSNINRVGYNPASETLFVEFHGGRLYAYDGVPAKVYREFEAASSLGQFLNLIIKPGYSFRQIGGKAAKKASK